MIGFTLKLMFTRGLAMKRWNNFPRIEDVSHLDNVGYVIHVALFLAYLEERNGNKIDKSFLIKRIIFNSLSSLLISDINSGTRDYIKKVDSEIFDKIENKAFDFILSKDAPEYLKEDIKGVLNEKEKELELLIIKVAKKYAGYRECKVNQKVFTEMYDVPLSQISSVLDENRGKLKSLNTLLDTPKYVKHLAHIRRLSHSMRWSGQTRIFPISVMSHLVIITYISYVIGTIENENGANLDMEDLLLRAIYHDIPEAITGDIITPTKQSIEGFRDVLEKVETQMMNDYIFSNVESEYKEEVFGYMLNPFDGEVGKVAKHADTLSALFEAKVEKNYGGRNYSEIYIKVKKVINNYHTKSVDYMLKNVIDSFDEKIDSINFNEK